jgi:hypothetical protein
MAAGMSFKPSKEADAPHDQSVSASASKKAIATWALLHSTELDAARRSAGVPFVTQKMVDDVWAGDSSLTPNWKVIPHFVRATLPSSWLRWKPSSSDDLVRKLVDGFGMLEKQDVACFIRFCRSRSTDFKNPAVLATAVNTVCATDLHKDDVFHAFALSQYDGCLDAEVLAWRFLACNANFAFLRAAYKILPWVKRLLLAKVKGFRPGRRKR